MSLLIPVIKLISFLNFRTKVYFAAILCLAILNSFFELLVVTAITPLLTVIIDPSGGTPYLSSSPLSVLFSELSSHISPLSLFLVLIIFCTFIRIFTLHVSCNLVFHISHEISTKVFSRIVTQPLIYYQQSVLTDFSTATSVLVSHSAGSIYILILLTLAIFSTIFVSLGIFISSPLATVLIAIPIIFSYTIVTIFTKKTVNSLGNTITNSTLRLAEYTLQVCRNINNVLLSNTPKNLYHDYKEIDLRLRWSDSRSRFFTDFPRFLLEAIGFILLAVVAFYFSVYTSDPAKSIGFIASLAFGLQKILPAIQQIYSGTAKINILNSSTLKINTFLKLPASITSQFDQPISCNSLHLNDITFQYPGAHTKTLENINLVLESGQMIGLIGTSGAGKSTFLNIILGLYEPTSGSMICDSFLNDRSIKRLDIFSSSKNLNSWHAICAYLPQDIQLINGSILDNIAFPFPPASLDIDTLDMALETCCLREFVNSLPNGIHSLIGDNGNSLSGGQRQRLSLARAIIKQPQILVLDEATSAMDNSTESKIINNLSRLPFTPTIIMCAHRLSSLAYCSKVYKLSVGSLSLVKL